MRGGGGGGGIGGVGGGGGGKGVGGVGEEAGGGRKTTWSLYLPFTYLTTLEQFSDLCHRLPGLHALAAELQFHSHTHMPAWFADGGLGGGGGGGGRDVDGGVDCGGVISRGIWSG